MHSSWQSDDFKYGFRSSRALKEFSGLRTDIRQDEENNSEVISEASDIFYGYGNCASERLSIFSGCICYFARETGISSVDSTEECQEAHTTYDKDLGTACLPFAYGNLTLNNQVFLDELDSSIECFSTSERAIDVYDRQRKRPRQTRNPSKAKESNSPDNTGSFLDSLANFFRNLEVSVVISAGSGANNSPEFTGGVITKGSF